jgi:feruloyl esterase
MIRQSLILETALCAFLLAASGAAAEKAKVCADLTSLAIPDTRITAAVEVAPQPDWRPAPDARGAAIKVPFCRVQGTIEKEINFELWLPDPPSWRGRFLGAGVGGDAGNFNFTDLPRGVNRGYAAATTDTGHKSSDRTWMMGDPIKLQNYELRANHLLPRVSKRIINEYYGAPARFAYFIGCSGGGRQGLKEMQRFPEDYDGIISGASGPKTPEMTVRRMWELLLRDQNPGLMAPADWQMIAGVGVKACDALDGVDDGMAEDPRKCSFSLSRLQCPGDKREDCLTREQVEFADKFYRPLRDEHGRAIDEGLLPGVLVDSGRSRLALATFGQAVRRDADWTGEGFSVAGDLAAVDRVMPELRADEPNVRAFKGGGGKMIMYQGWLDPAVAAKMTIAYYEQVEKAMGGEAETRDFLRLFMMPGVYHCMGGPGPDRIGGSGADAPIVDADHDLLSALERWVEQGKPPERIIASKVVNDRVVRTRPLCPYPEYARYKGEGPVDDANNFECARN